MSYQPLSSAGVSMLWPLFTILEAIKESVSFAVLRMIEIIVPIKDEDDDGQEISGPTFWRFMLALVFFGLLIGTIHYSSGPPEVYIPLILVTVLIYVVGLFKAT